MVSDSITHASIPSSNPRDFAKKKRANRSAKLKQCKLDARREQWLSHVKSKGGCKVELTVGGIVEPIGKLEIKIRIEEKSYGDRSSIHNYSDSESPTSHTSSISGSNDSVANFTASSRSSSSISTNGFYSNMSEEEEEEEEDDDCLDDWEAVADALAANDNNKNTTKFDYPPHEDSKEISKPSVNPIRVVNARTASLANCCAWRADDASRPKALPNLSKQYSLPLKSERYFGPIPTACPICFEDLDNTDSSFLPCPCGFRLCLFCHKRIVEEDGRCPGCRKEYKVERNEGTFRLARSCSVVTRS